MIALIPAVFAVAALIWWWRRRALRKLRATTPLAGMDTGVRSHWRTPGSLFAPRRGF